MFRIDGPVRNEALNLAVVMNTLHVSEKKACSLLDSLDRRTACEPLLDDIQAWQELLNIPRTSIINEYEKARDAFTSLHATDEIIRLGNPDYPVLLARTDEAPRFLYLRGRIGLLRDIRTVALVGSRQAGDEGKRNTERVARILGANGIIITERMANALGIKVGDQVSLENVDGMTRTFTVDGICENYVNHYVYMTENYYAQIFGEKSYNAIITNMNQDQVEKIGNDLMATEKFSNIQYTTDSMNMFQDVIRSMNDIVLLIIGFSTFLAITVLYNLTTINISERTREIATLKVLGFHDREVSQYVYRETLVLTIVGILVGLGLGVLLNQFVMTVAETDEILFVKDIYGLSYLYTFLIMTLFTVFVQFITYFILKKINMIDSLKSVE